MKDYSESLIQELLAPFFPSKAWTVQSGASGMNNTTRYVAVEGQKYVLRIYNTHSEAEKVAYEHEILKALAKMDKPFLTPKPVKLALTQSAIEGYPLSTDTDTVARSSSGKIASLFHYIEGTNPAMDSAHQVMSFGRAIGQLTELMAQVHVSKQPIYNPYYEIEHTHPSCNLEEVARFCMESPQAFENYRHDLQFIGEQLIQIKERLPAIRQLPHQLIHGDLNGSNALVADGDQNQISAVLDFEFVTHDLRAMELAVSLSDIIRLSDSSSTITDKISALLKGYGSAAKLTKDEIDAIPLLLQLRRLDVFIHFLGRYLDQVDPADILQRQIKTTASKTRWFADQEGAIVTLCRRFIA